MTPTHILFDFFGTLVEYSESRLAQDHRGSYERVRALGARADYGEFLARWDETFDGFERRAIDSLDEYSMDAVCAEFLGRLLGHDPGPEATTGFRDAYLAEWSAGVVGIPGVADLLSGLSRRHALVLVTNTHHADLVRGHLQRLGIDGYFARVITSVEHGRRKPSPCIFERALREAGGRPDAAIHVGDSFAADYVGAGSLGLRCLLIDPAGRFDVPERDRLHDVLDVRDRLAEYRSA